MNSLKSSQNSVKILVKEFVCDALRDLVPFVQLKKRERCPWEVLLLVKLLLVKLWLKPVTLVFFTFFKLCKWYQIAQSITFLVRSKAFIIQVY